MSRFLILEDKIIYVRYCLAGALLFLVVGSIDLISKYPSPVEPESFLPVGVPIFFVIYLFLLEKHLKVQLGVKRSGLSIDSFTVEINKQLNTFQVRGHYDYQGRNYKIHKSIERSEPESFNVIENKGDAVQVSLKVDPLNPKYHFLSFS